MHNNAKNIVNIINVAVAKKDITSLDNMFQNRETAEQALKVIVNLPTNFQYNYICRMQKNRHVGYQFIVDFFKTEHIYATRLARECAQGLFIFGTASPAMNIFINSILSESLIDFSYKWCTLYTTFFYLYVAHAYCNVTMTKYIVNKLRRIRNHAAFVAIYNSVKSHLHADIVSLLKEKYVKCNAQCMLNKLAM